MYSEKSVAKALEYLCELFDSKDTADVAHTTIELTRI